MIAAGRAPASARGRLELVFSCDTGRTTLARAHVSAPLKIVRPFTLADGRALVQVLTLGPGLCAGDDVSLDVVVESGARAVVVMQAASRILGMPPEGRARQSVKLTVRPGGHLEYYPGLTIPFADSCFEQRIDVTASHDSRLGLLERWSMGRTSRGEHLQFRRVCSRTTVVIDGAPVYADAIELEPAATAVDTVGILEGFRYIASGFWHGVSSDVGPLQQIDESAIAFGRSSPDQVYFRGLARDGHALSDVMCSAVDRVNAAWGLLPIPIGRFTA